MYQKYLLPQELKEQALKRYQFLKSLKFLFPVDTLSKESEDTSKTVKGSEKEEELSLRRDLSSDIWFTLTPLLSIGMD